MLKKVNIKWLFMIIALSMVGNAQNIPPEGIVMKLEPIGMKIAQTFVTTEMLDAYKKQLVQRVVTAQPQYQGQETKIIAWLDISFKMRDYLFYLGQSIGTKFNAEEENEIVAFLSTPVGQKFIKESNFISKESARVAAALVQKNLPTLADYIKNLEDNKTKMNKK